MRGRRPEREGGEGMEVIVRGAPEEIAALVRAAQERQSVGIEVKSPIDTIVQAVRQAIGGTAGASQNSSLPLSGT